MASIIRNSLFIPINKNISATYCNINLIHTIFRRDAHYTISSLPTFATPKSFIQHKSLIDENELKPTSVIRRFSYVSTPTLLHVRAQRSNTDDLDTLFKALLFEIEHKHMVEKAAILKILSVIEEKKFIKDIYVDFLIGCCTELLRNESKSERLALTQRVHEVLRRCIELNITNHNELLRCYVVNGHRIVPDQHIKDIYPLKPNRKTFYLLLEAVCVAGDVNEAKKIVETMKSKSIKMNEMIYDNLIEAYGKSGDYEKALGIRDEMICLGLNITANTQKALIMSSIYNGRTNDLDEYFSYATDNELELSEKHIMDIVKCMAQNNHENLIPNVLRYLPMSDIKNVGMSPFVRSACAEIIHMGHPNVAYLIYDVMPLNTDLTQEEDIGKDCRSLLTECIIASTPIDVVKNIIAGLIESRRNVLALEAACKAALQFNKPNIAKELLKTMKEQGKSIRPHYFWPLMVNESLTHGEGGIFSVLSFMKSLDIAPDFETFLLYILPNVSLASPELLMKKFQLHGVTASMALTPMLIALINTHQFGVAIQLCDTFEGRLDCDNLLQPLYNSYLATENVTDVVTILNILTKRTTDCQQDWIGKFLILMLNRRKWSVTANPFLWILERLLQHEKRISPLSVDTIVRDLFKLNPTSDEMVKLRSDIMSMVDNGDTRTVDIVQPIYKHPNNMTVEELEGHLIELESNGMNTRGILRKLLQQHCRLGNIEKAKNISEKCENLKMDFSPGMKANMLDIYVKSDNIEKAEIFWKNLMAPDSKFNLDDHKILDYATLLVKNKRIDEAFKILKSCTITGSLNRMKAIESNCFRLLNAISDAGTTKQSEGMLSLLVSRKLCTETNVLLGSLIRTNINRSDIPGAVKTFIHCVNRYKKTPLKVELLSILAKSCNEFGDVPIPMSPKILEDSIETNPDKQKHNQYKKLLRQVIEMDVKLYGSEKSKISVIAALAESDLRKPLKRYLLDTTVPINEAELIKQCQRFVKENKVSALELLVNCLDGNRSVDQNNLHEIIMEAYNMNGNCTAALELWKNIQTHDVKPQQRIAERLCSILKSHRVQVPIDVIKYAASHKNDSITNMSARL